MHALTNALALLPATTQQSQQTQQLDAILQQVQHFYGEGWNSLQASNALMGLLLSAVFAVAVGMVYFETKKIRKKIKKARNAAHEETEAAIRQIEKARQEASESIKQQQTEMTALIKQEASKAKNASTSLVLRLTAAQISGEYGNSVTSPQQLRYAIQLLFFSMCYASVAGAYDLCQIAKVQLTQTLYKVAGPFNGSELARELQGRRNNLSDAAEPGDDKCESLIQEILNTISNTSKHQNGISPKETATSGTPTSQRPEDNRPSTT